MDYLTIEEVAKKIKVTPRTVSKWINRSYHPLPVITISPKIKRIRSIDLDKWMEEEAQETQEVRPLEVYNGKI
jgi:transcriptional regulator with XRE-family HTH domain